MFWIFVFIKYKRPPAGYGQALPRRTFVARKGNLNCLPKIPKGTFPYEKKVLVSIGSNTFFALKYWKFAKKVLDPILTNTFCSYGF